MLDLAHLRNVSRPKKKVQRVGRGPGSKRGLRSGRGGKGDSARQGYRKRFGYEGGQVPLYRKLPVRGFTRGLFAKPMEAISLHQLDRYFAEGEVVDVAALRAKGLISRHAVGGVKILANGRLSKQLKKIEAHGFSKGAIAKLEEQKIPFQVIA